MVETSNGLSLGYAPYRGWPPVSPNLESLVTATILHGSQRWLMFETSKRFSLDSLCA